ncbi:MAG: hypothetical protein ACPGJV_00230 [Bacteriovoracaceae bacterium]
MANCRYCGKEIVWVLEGKKKVPLDMDGGKHQCEEFKNARNSFKKLTPTDIDPDILKQYQDSMNKAANKK